MPEGPELAHSRDRLKHLLLGKTVKSLNLGPAGRYTKEPPEGYNAFVEETLQSGPGPEVEEIATKGKFMWWRFRLRDRSAWHMWCTYGMSGGWFTNSSKHTALSIGTDDQHLFFNDPRHFGTVKFSRSEEDLRRKLATLGPCILGGEVTPEIFVNNALRKPERTISEALMDQSVVSGVGNYIKAECLHRAGISPWRPVTEVTPEEYGSLCGHVLDVAKESYESQGATISTYRTVDGSRGTTQFSFRVYSRGECPLGHPTRREGTPDGRTSHWCPICQK